MKKYLSIPLLMVSMVVFAKIVTHFFYTDTSVFTPHTTVWFNYIVRTELNQHVSQYKPYDRVNIVHGDKITTARFLPNGNFEIGALGLGSGRLYEQVFGGSRGDRDGRGDSGEDLEVWLRANSDQLYNDFLRRMEEDTRRYGGLTGRINERCSGTVPNNPDCDR